MAGRGVSPCLAGRVDDVVICVEDVVAEVVGAQIVPSLFDRVELREHDGSRIGLKFFDRTRMPVNLRLAPKSDLGA